MAICSIQPGHQSGGLTVVKFHHKQRKGKSWANYWECLCDCGNTAIVRSDSLTGPRRTIHCRWHTKGIVHGMSRTPEYRARIGMLSRCYDKKRHYYPDYGGRGIRVCEEWRNSFEAFYRDVGPRPSAKHSLERTDNNGNYEPSNVKWAIRLEQQQNTRHNHYVTFNGERLCISECARRVGIGHTAMAKRIKRWGVEKALTAPKQTEHDQGKAALRHLAR